jgi:fibronectin-binding autotransporter adhesin
VNNGTISADSLTTGSLSGTLNINANITNNGQMNVSGFIQASTLAFGSITVNQGQGSITATNTGVVSLTGTVVNGGAISNQGGSIFLVGATLNGVNQTGTLTTVVGTNNNFASPIIGGGLSIVSNSTATFSGPLVTISGIVTVNSDQGPIVGAAQFVNPTTVSGSGAILLDAPGLDAQLTTSGPGTMTLDTEAEGEGQINGNFTNNSSIIGDVAGQSLVLSGQITNNDQIQAMNGGGVIINPSTLTNFNGNTLTGGSYGAGAGSFLTLPGVLNTNDADLTLGGSGATINGLNSLGNNLGSINLLNGAGLNLGPIINSGTISIIGQNPAPDSALIDAIPAGSATSLTITGNYTQTTGLTLVQGNLTVTGAIIINGGTFQIGDGGSITGNIVNNAAVVVNCNDSPTIPNNFSGTGYFTTNGSGTVTLTGSNTYTGPAIVQSGSLVIGAAGALPKGNNFIVGTPITAASSQLAIGIGPTTVSALTIGPGSTLDITNNVLNVNYGAASDPAATIRGYLTSARAGGWQGAGLNSSLVAANPSSFAVGYADGGNATDHANTGVPAGEVEVMYTVAGDVNLSGAVDLSDLVIIASDFGETGADWAQGDVNYDGNVDLSDLVIIASNFGASLSSDEAFSKSFQEEWQLALAETHSVAVPEPSAVVLAVGGLLLRRRRHLNKETPPSKTGRSR